jgi:hypothetical protein
MVPVKRATTKESTGCSGLVFYSQRRQNGGVLLVDRGESNHRLRVIHGHLMVLNAAQFIERALGRERCIATA